MCRQDINKSMLYLLEQEVSCQNERVLRRDRPGGKLPEATKRAKGVVWSSGWAILPIERVTGVDPIYGVAAEAWIRLLSAPAQT